MTTITLITALHYLLRVYLHGDGYSTDNYAALCGQVGIRLFPGSRIKGEE